jgi:putative lipoic acid-binding regulatory protein
VVTSAPLLTYPTDYPIKVVGRASGTLRADADAIISRHAPDFDATLTRERLSANGNFLSLSYTIRAVSTEQVTALAAELNACESIIIVF